MNAILSNVAQESVINNFNEMVLSKEQIETITPEVYYTQPSNPNLSKYYTMASTETVIEDMKKLGWEVVQTRRPKHYHRRVSYTTIGTMHMVVFQNPNVFITNEAGEVVAYPRIILTNSHDGFCSFRFRIGLLRPESGMFFILSSDKFESFHIRHMGYTFDELRELVSKTVEAIPTYVEVMNNMQNHNLTDDEKYKLALAALRVRRGDDEYEASEIVLDMILEPTRESDEKDDLWTILNIIQEKMMTGMFKVVGKNGKCRKARAIKSIGKEIQLNQALFKVAVGFIEK